MKERPILFSAPMIRAILAGTKTQTRRLCKPEWLRCLDPDDAEDRAQAIARCPYGAPGDRLWVKEAWRPRVPHEPPDSADVFVTYAADGEERYFDEHQADDNWTMPKAAKMGNVTPLFMPRWASRITLEITDMRVERVQSISDADIAAEGVTEAAVRELRVHKSAKAWTDTVGATPRDLWRIGWSTINGAESWAANPWVWCLSFRRIAR